MPLRVLGGRAGTGAECPSVAWVSLPPFSQADRSLEPQAHTLGFPRQTPFCRSDMQKDGLLHFVKAHHCGRAARTRAPASSTGLLRSVTVARAQAGAAWTRPASAPPAQPPVSWHGSPCCVCAHCLGCRSSVSSHKMEKYREVGGEIRTTKDSSDLKDVF